MCGGSGVHGEFAITREPQSTTRAIEISWDLFWIRVNCIFKYHIYGSKKMMIILYIKIFISNLMG